MIPAYVVDGASRQPQMLSGDTLRRATLAHVAPAVIHELRQPLTAILSSAAGCERLLAQDIPSREALAAGIGMIRRNAERAVGTMRSLQQLFVEGGLQRRRLDLTGTLAETAAQLADRAQDLGVRLEQVQSVEALCVDGDGILLRQAVVNLVENALQAAASADGEPAVQLRAVGAEHRCLRVTVADSGSGVPPGCVSRIFQPFVTSRSEGMGIGLWLARTIAEAHGGTISVGRDAALGGAAFHLVLPAARA
ncbi:sensor histidine kinase [Spiribacter halobius]|nr:HAMP domain-containing sensor histidine kinase [Spiribacter halobius]UEX79615.1 HAMP domain-containing histidine kinase [Spiribacter halobius]